MDSKVNNSSRLDDLFLPIDRNYVIFGTFEGLVSSASPHILLALYWTIFATRKYMKAKSSGSAVQCSIWYSTTLCRKKIPLDRWILLFVSIFFLYLQIRKSFDNLNYVIDAMLQMSLFFGALIHSLVAILKFYKFLGPSPIDYFTFFIMYAIPIFVIVNHFKGRSLLEMQLYLFLCIIHICTCLIIIMEAIYRCILLYPLLRSFLNLLIATWTIHMAFILFSSDDAFYQWIRVDPTSSAKIVPLAFLLAHCLFDGASVLILSFAARPCCSPRPKNRLLDSSRLEEEKCLGTKNTTQQI